MGRLLLLLVCGILFFSMLRTGLRLLGDLGRQRRELPRGYGGPPSRETAALLPAVQTLVAQFLAASRQELPRRLDDLSALLRSVEATAKQQGVALDASQAKDLVARAIAARGVAPDYQVRTLLDFV